MSTILSSNITPFGVQTILRLTSMPRVCQTPTLFPVRSLLRLSYKCLNWPFSPVRQLLLRRAARGAYCWDVHVTVDMRLLLTSGTDRLRSATDCGSFHSRNEIRCSLCNICCAREWRRM